MSSAVRCFIAIGSNLGDRRRTIERAVELIRDNELIDGVRVSKLIENAAVGGPKNSPAFLNGAIELLTKMTPRELLHFLLHVESLLGRERRERWAARTIDLDVLLYGDRVISLPELTVPHPRLRERRFVLQPLLELAPDLTMPDTQASVATLLAILPPSQAIE